MLYVIASPIGNLEDMTFRSVKTLEQVDLILCEDTRITKKLLNHYNITKPLIRYVDDETKQDFYLEKIKNNDVALISDAGTPLLSDPGYKIVKIAIENHIMVSPLPGASSLMTALSITGKNISNFSFEGFFPKLKSNQKLVLSKLRYTSYDSFFFESPKRVNKTLKLLKDNLVDRHIVIFHELTKLNEKMIHINLKEQINFELINKGEYVILISGAGNPKQDIDEDFREYVKSEMEYMLQNGLSLKNATKIISEIFDLPRKDIYNIWIDK
tara:strand:+ start:4135 stop:4944 length:810 start_codon:yes stop_codon:yes gene_type:complete